MQRAMARQAEAERERRAKIINAEGEFQASERLKDAALVIEKHPIALQLRYLQTLLEIGGSNSSTIIFPAPVDLIRPFLERAEAKTCPTSAATRSRAGPWRSPPGERSVRVLPARRRRRPRRTSSSNARSAPATRR